MKGKTTIALFLTVLLVGGYIWFVDRKAENTAERKAEARRALRVEPARVDKLSLVSDDVQVVCERASKRWVIISPVRARADTQVVESLLESLGGLMRSDIITAAEQKELGLSNADYGLDVPRARITLDQGAQSTVLLVGRDAPLGGHFYMQMQGSEDIIVTATNLLSALPKSITDLRDRNLLQGTISDTSRLDIRRSDGFLQMARTGDGDWRLLKPVEGRAARPVVQRVLDQVFDARILDFVADSVAAYSLYGLDEPVAQVSTVSETSGLEQTLLLGKTLDSNTNQIYASIQGADAVYAVSSSLLAALRIPLNEFRDRRLVPLTAYDVLMIKIEKDEQTLTLQTTNASEWLVVEPRQYPTDRARVVLLLSDWLGMDVQNFYDDYATNAAALGLSAPAMKITFARLPGTGPADSFVLHVADGASTNGLVKVAQAGQNTIFDIREGPVRSLSLDPLWYRNRTMLQVDPVLIRSVQVQTAGGTQSVLRESVTNEFRAAETNAVINRDALAELQDLVRYLRAETLVEENPKDLAKYALSSPVASLTVGLSGVEGIGKTVLFGAETPDDTCYAMVKGQDVVFTVMKAVRDKLVASLYKVPPSEKKPDANGTIKPAEALP